MNGELHHPTTIYTGDFCHALDVKKRVTVPARWRTSEVDVFYTVPSPKGTCLRVFPPHEMSRIREEVRSSKDIPAKERSVFERFFFSEAQHVTTDKQGRILLPEKHCTHCNLKEEVMLIGADSKFEIWNPELWRATLVDSEPVYGAVSERIGLD
ncbi:MAG: division/cell wall cluster transcriptional repressor MraZ [Verrucomicrobiales bacterium]